MTKITGLIDIKDLDNFKTIRQPILCILVPVIVGYKGKTNPLNPVREAYHIFNKETLEFIGEIDKYKQGKINDFLKTKGVK